MMKMAKTKCTYQTQISTQKHTYTHATHGKGSLGMTSVGMLPLLSAIRMAMHAMVAMDEATKLSPPLDTIMALCASTLCVCMCVSVYVCVLWSCFSALDIIMASCRCVYVSM